MALLTFSWLIDVTILFLTLLFAAYLYMTRNFNYWKKRGVVEIPPVPFFGNLGKYFTLQMSSPDLFKSFYDQGENLPYVGIYHCDKPSLILRDPEIIKQVLVTDFNSFCDRHLRSTKHDNISNNSLISIDNPQWKFVRNSLTNLFSPAKIKSAFENGQEIVKDFNDRLDSMELEGAGKKLDLKQLANDFTVDFIGLVGFGLKLNSLRDPNEFRRVSEKMFGTYTWRRAMELNCVFITPQFSTLFGCRFFEKKSCDFFKTALKEIMHERETKKIKRNDYIDLLIDLKNNKDSSADSYGFKFEGDNLMAQALLFFAAGYGTTATTIIYAFYLLAKNPDVQSKLRTEINEARAKNNGNITYEMITELRYLDMVISETLRMYNLQPFIDRVATKDYKIKKTGLIIEKGTTVFVPTYGLQYDPKYFPNPDVFDPERFSEKNKSSIDPTVCLGFGLGPRSCIGLRQGLLQSKLCVSILISRFELSIPKDFSAVLIDPISYAIIPKGGLFLNVRKIDAQSNK